MMELQEIEKSGLKKDLLFIEKIVYYMLAYPFFRSKGNKFFANNIEYLPSLFTIFDTKLICVKCEFDHIAKLIKKL